MVPLQLNLSVLEVNILIMVIKSLSFLNKII